MWYAKIRFSKTYEKIEENSNKIWKNQRYKLIKEYKDVKYYELFIPVVFQLYDIYRHMIFKSEEIEEEKSEFVIIIIWLVFL